MFNFYLRLYYYNFKASYHVYCSSSLAFHETAYLCGWSVAFKACRFLRKEVVCVPVLQ